MPKHQTNRYKHKIEVWGNRKEKNELNETVYKFAKLKSPYAEVVPQTGSLIKQQADTILTNVTHKIVMRYESGKDITKDMQIHFRGHRFEIKYILNPYFVNEKLEIFVQELVR
ncbi:phage head closure protein [Rummeliibacillus sp. NPDC094406]|uniref:phage head closure protein n=1 Tax=Rummeliibacillus sp. NPDC094406 TaxID=3364511 RepID=UPI003823AF22